jgi:hypothetical protein
MKWGAFEKRGVAVVWNCNAKPFQDKKTENSLGQQTNATSEVLLSIKKTILLALFKG